MKPSSVVAGRLLLALLSSAIALAGAELGLRHYLDSRTYRDSAISVPQLSPPGEPEMRSPRTDLSKAAGTFRILVVGDSYTFGDGVYAEDAYPRRIQTRLQALRPNQRIEVVSWARRGWNTAQELVSVKPHFDHLDPDLLILGFSLNDTEPENPSDRAKLRQGILPRRPTGRFSGWLSEHSILVDRLWESFETLRLRRELARYYRELHGDGPGVAECRRALMGFRRLARQHRIRMLAVIFPIFDSQFDHRYRYRELHGSIAERLEEMNIMTLDLLPFFEGFDARRLAVTPFTDPHPNELGHRIAADAIVRHLLRKNLVPATEPDTDS